MFNNITVIIFLLLQVPRFRRF